MPDETQNEIQERYPSSGISVLIVGAGVAGLMAALECSRQGHVVRIVERASSRLLSGDGFSIGHSALRGLRYWPKMVAENEQIAFHPWMSWHKITGDVISGPEPFVLNSSEASSSEDKEDRPDAIYRHSRPKFHKMLSDQAERMGINIEYGVRVSEYYEKSDTSSPGVLLENGDRIEADVVIAADGIGSKSSLVTMGHMIPPIPTGYAIYRAAFSNTISDADPLVKERFQPLKDGTPVTELWVGEDIMASFCRSEDEFTWIINYKDDSEMAESWSRLIEPEAVLKKLEGIQNLPEVVKRVISITPHDRLHDFKLMWREPHPCWVSPSGCIVQIGDAAHSFLPSSGNGATQAMEDAISLATCLRLAGKDAIKSGTTVHNKLRFERVACLQLLGIINQQSRSKVAKSKSPATAKKIIGLLGSWIWRHNPEVYAVENFDKAHKAVTEGAEFENTNIPPGYKYRPWKIADMLEAATTGDIELEGNWD